MDIKDFKIQVIPKPLTGFVGEITMSIGMIKLVEFVVVDRPAIYNNIMGHHG